MPDSVRPHRWQPTRLPHPWDSPGKNTGVSCHFLIQCMKVKSGSEIIHSGPTLSDPMDCSLPGSSVHGIFQARVMEWSAMWGLFLNTIFPLLPSCWGFSFGFGHGVSFISGIPHSPVNGCSAVSCNFGVIAEEEHMPPSWSQI